MALIIDLKPGEKILIGQAVITNDSQRTRLHIAGDAPIMREKDVMQEAEADSPCKRVYFFIQAMYLARNPKPLFDPYFELVGEIQAAAPILRLNFLKINDAIRGGLYYKALKEARALINIEQELIANVAKQVANVE